MALPLLWASAAADAFAINSHGLTELPAPPGAFISVVWQQDRTALLTDNEGRKQDAVQKTFVKSIVGRKLEVCSSGGIAVSSEPVQREYSLHRAAIGWLPVAVVSSLAAVVLLDVLESRGEIGFLSALGNFFSDPLLLAVIVPVWVATAYLGAWLASKLGTGGRGSPVRRE